MCIMHWMDHISFCSVLLELLAFYFKRKGSSLSLSLLPPLPLSFCLRCLQAFAMLLLAMEGFQVEGHWSKWLKLILEPASDKTCTHKLHENSWQIVLVLKDYWVYIPTGILTLLLTYVLTFPFPKNPLTCVLTINIQVKLFS